MRIGKNNCLNRMHQHERAVAIATELSSGFNKIYYQMYYFYGIIKMKRSLNHNMR